MIDERAGADRPSGGNLMLTTARLLGLSVLLILMSACTDDDGDSAASNGGETTETVEAATAVDSSAPASPADTGPGGVGTLDDPRSIVDGTFTYTEGFSDTDWSGQLYGLVELPLESYSDLTGRCLAVVGVITPTRIGEGSVSQGFTAPGLGLVVEGILVDDGFDCDTAEVREAGYGALFEAQVTAGTEFAFFQPFLVEGDPAPAPTALFVGEAGNDQTVYFTTDVLPSLPTPTVRAGTGVEGDLRPLAGATFGYRGRFDDAAWDVELVGVVEAEKGSFTDESGSCLIVIGNLTPRVLDVGQVSAGFDTPDFSLLAGGVAIDDEGGCELEAVEAAGYGALWEAQVTVGTVYPFHAAFFVPDGVEAASVIVGDPTEDGGARFYSVDVIPTVPQADTSASLGVLPEGIAPITGARFEFTDPFSETSWEAVIDGVVSIDVDPFYDDEVGRCYAVLGVITPTSIGEGSFTDGFDTPSVGLIAAGRSMLWNSFFCDDENLEANGYRELDEAEVPVGTDYAYFVPFFVPGDESVALDAVFVGDATEADALYFDPSLLEAIPSRN